MNLRKTERSVLSGKGVRGVTKALYKDYRHKDWDSFENVHENVSENMLLLPSVPLQICPR